MVGAAEFWDRMAVKYAASAIGDPESYAFTLDRTRHFLSSGTRALEIGCGTGSTALDLAGNVTSILGTDVSPRMIDIARDKAAAAGCDNVSFEVRTAFDAMSASQDIDAVLAFNILHLVPDLPKLLAEINKGLQAGEMFISKTPCIMDPSIGFKRYAIRVAVPLAQLIGKAPEVNMLTFDGLETAITQAGFKIIETCSRPAMSRYIVARKT